MTEFWPPKLPEWAIAPPDWAITYGARVNGFITAFRSTVPIFDLMVVIPS